MAMDHWVPACQSGVEHVVRLALVQLGLGDRAKARDGLVAGCKGGDAWACELQKELKLR
jgi:hypothetical protein